MPSYPFQSDSRKKIQDFELELSERQAERDHFSAHNQELQKQLAQSQEGTASPFQPTDCLTSRDLSYQAGETHIAWRWEEKENNKHDTHQ